jgi:uncharacterized protein (DUF2235 family)
LVEQQRVETKRIVLLSDGTGNSAAKLFRTNVWRLYHALALSNGEQVAMYDDGVGTSRFRPLAILGGALGWGLKRNILDLYIFLCRNYQPNDRIYLFGFSRGAFTVRVLAKFILSQGLVSNFYSDDDLRAQARRRYRAFRKNKKTRFGLATLGRWIRDAWFRLADYLLSRSYDDTVIPIDEIEFVGVWDTVDAYGIPISELKNGIDRYIWPLELDDKYLAGVKKACHAIGLDDKRRTFHPLLWDESEADTAVPLANNTNSETLTQVFFAGVHSNIGGGYPDDGLSHVSLNWMMKEAAKRGLRFKPLAVHQISNDVAPFGKLYDSRAGLGSYYRYEPRNFLWSEASATASIRYPKIHETVLLRIVSGTDSYSPLSLPTLPRVVIEDDWPSVLSGNTLKKNVLTLQEFGSSRDRTCQAYGHFQLSKEAVSAIRYLENPQRAAVDLIWDTVWWRRISYFATLFVSVLLLIFPLFSVLKEYPIHGFALDAFGISVSNTTYQSLLAPVVTLLADSITKFVPSIFGFWVNAFRDQPFNFILLLLSLLLCLVWGAVIDRRINDRSIAVWNESWSNQRLKWFKEGIRWRFRATLACCLISLVLAAWLFYLERYVPREECTGFACIGDVLRTISRVFTGIFLLTVSGISAIGLVAVWRISKKSTDLAVEPRGTLLLISHGLRTSILAVFFDLFSSRLVPAMFALSVAYLAVAGVNRVFFLFFNVTGAICPISRDPSLVSQLEDEPIIKVLYFDSGCVVTHVALESSKKYKVSRQEDLTAFDTETNDLLKSIDEDEEASATEKAASKAEKLKERSENREVLARLFDPTFRNSTEPSISSINRMILAPLLRSWRTGWYQPIVRVGNVGDNEYFFLPSSGEVEFTAPDDGGAYLYLNNAVLGWPSIFDFFYRQKGGILVRFERKDN